MSQTNTPNRDLIMRLISIGEMSFCFLVSADIIHISYCAKTKNVLCNILMYQLELSSHHRDLFLGIVFIA